jgi:hypothetical protein
MKPVAMMIAGLVGLVMAFMVQTYVATVLFLLSCFTLLLVLAGTLVPVQSRMDGLVFPAAEPGSFIPEWPCLESKKLDPYQDQSLRFRIETKGFGLLGMIGIAALYFIQLVVSRRGNPFRPYREAGQSGEYVLFFVLLFLCFVPVTIAVSWFFERIRLVSSGIAIGSFDPHTGGYTFCDQHGARHGGTRKPMPPRPDDNICVVFYGRKNPESNTSSAGLWFHRLQLQAVYAERAD